MGANRRGMLSVGAAGHAWNLKSKGFVVERVSGDARRRRTESEK
jgi:hypothetical protein